MFLGISQQSGLVYEGIERPNLPAVPIPVVTPAKLIEAQQDWNSLPVGIGDFPLSRVFREDSFDAVTRTRRGRLYVPTGGVQPLSHQVIPHPSEDRYGETAGPQGRHVRNLYVYMSDMSLLSKPWQGMGSTIALGTLQAASAWRIVQTEVLANKCVMVTLKSLSAFGILPDLDKSKVPEGFRATVAQAMERVLNSAFRETPISVIDHCRNALTMLLSRWMVAQGHDRSILRADLNKVAVTIAGVPHEKECVSQLARLVARLHVRGKGNEAETKGLREPIEEDAELALHAVGFALRDIGWAV
ncbi:MAG: hypothetical protein AAB403_02450 [Planctomycetota bacterium]